MRASVVARALAIEGVDLVHVARARRARAPREGVIASRARGELRFAPGRRRCATRAASAWSVDGALAAIDATRRRTARLLSADLPRRARARVGGAHLPDLGRGAAVGGARLRVHRLGPPGARRRRQPRLAARLATRSARSCSAASSCPSPSRAQWAIRDVAPLVLAHFGLAAAARAGVTARAPLTAAPRRHAAVACARAGRVASPRSRARAARRASAVSAAAVARSRRSAPRAAAGAPREHATRRRRLASAARAPRRRRRNSEAPIPVAPSNAPPAGRRLSPDQVLAIADRAAEDARGARANTRGSYGGAYLKPAFHWQVSYFSRGGKKEIGQVIIDDLTGRVLEQWTGFQVAWTMARGYPGAFGRHVNALYIWLPLCVLFLLPFFDFRRPFSLLHLDLLVLLSFSVSLAFFNHAHIYASVPLAYPPLLYLLARMLALLRAAPRRGGRAARAAAAPARARALAGARRRLPARLSHRAERHRLERHRRRLRGRDRRAADRPRQAAVRLLSVRQRTRRHLRPGQLRGLRAVRADLRLERHVGRPAGRARRGDLLRPARRSRCCSCSAGACAGPTLGVALAYAWVSYPFTLFALESNSNDTLVAVLVLAALLAASYRSQLATAGARRVRGARRA